MKVAEVMTPDPIVVPPKMSVQALVDILADRHISGVFVVDAGGTPLGVVTEADLARRLAPERGGVDLGWISRLLVNPDRAAEHYTRTHGTTARDVMTAKLISVTEDQPAADAARLMRDERIRRVAVLRDNKLVGVVSRADLLKAVANEPGRIATESSDTRIRRTILKEMRRHPWADRSLTSVIVKDGVVRLEGYCRSEEAQQALRVLAEQVEGVREVIDRMDIAPSYPVVPPL